MDDSDDEDYNEDPDAHITWCDMIALVAQLEWLMLKFGDVNGNVVELSQKLWQFWAQLLHDDLLNSKQMQIDSFFLHTISLSLSLLNILAVQTGHHSVTTLLCYWMSQVTNVWPCGIYLILNAILVHQLVCIMSISTVLMTCNPTGWHSNSSTSANNGHLTICFKKSGQFTLQNGACIPDWRSV